MFNEEFLLVAPPGQSPIFVSRLTFSGGRPVIDDTNGTALPVTFTRDKDGEGSNNVYVYARNSYVKLETLTFKVLRGKFDQFRDKQARFVGTLIADGNPLGVAIDTGWGDYGGDGYTFTNLQSLTTLPPVVNFYNLKISWEYQVQGSSTWHVAGVTRHGLYVTYGLPDKEIPLYETLLDYGCTSAAGRGQKDPMKILAGIWSNFSSGNTPTTAKGPANAKRADGEDLKYYGSWSFPSTTWSDLLKTGDGQCNAWQGLFYAAIMAQGLLKDPTIAALNIRFGKIEPTNADELFLVNNWRFPMTGLSLQKAYPYTNFLGRAVAKDKLEQYPFFDNIGGQWQYVWDKSRKPDVTDLSGTPGQNSKNPISTFDNHAVVVIGNLFYDPSYGVIYGDAATPSLESSKSDFQKRAIAGFYKINDKAIPPDGTKAVRAMMIRKIDSKKVEVKVTLSTL